ncbi:MAG: Ni/Fe hydrogenase subunit alpha [Planctomycetota bacterium]
MTRRIVIDPVTRIEGHAKISIYLDDGGQVADARFHVTEFRGFEKFCEGRSFREMPTITARICGICPVSHLLTSAKAGDDLLAVEIPETAKLLRHLMNLGQIVQSHALSFFHLSGPDLFLGYDFDPARRNIFGLIERSPDLARKGIRLRKFGQEVIETLGGRKIHPTWAVPGGVSAPLSPEGREKILRGLPEALSIAVETLDAFKRTLDDRQEEIRVFGSFPSLFLGLVAKDGTLEHYDGGIRIVDGTGKTVADGLDPRRYYEYIGEAVESWSYLKFPYYKPYGYPKGIYRVGPLARLNVATRCGTPLADAELAEFRQLGRGAVLSSFHYHYARLVEILYALERMEEILDRPDVTSRDVRAFARRNRFEGVGAAEAPRGTLFHRYRVKDGGLVTWVDMIIATGQNNLAMNRTVLQIAKRFVDGNRLTEGMMNRVEAGIRAYDPCLSCSTHAAGGPRFVFELIGPDGRTVDVRVRT